MSGNFNDFDLEKELSHLTPSEMTLTRVGPWVVGSGFLDGLKAAVARLFTSDQDAILSIMKLAADKLLATSRSLEDDLLKLYILLPDALGADTPISNSSVLVLRSKFDDVKTGGVGKRRRMLQKVKKEIKKLVSSTTPKNAAEMGERNPSDVRAEIRELLTRIERKVEIVTTVNENFQNAITNYYESGLLQTATDVQADVILTRIDDFLRSGGVNVAQIVMTSSIGLGMLDERLTLREPLDPKYIGTVSVQPGQHAAIMGGVSLPFRLPGAVQSDLYVDLSTEAGTVRAPASSAPSVQVGVLHLRNYSEQEYANFYALVQTGTHFVPDMALPPYSVNTLPFPYPEGIIDQAGTSDTGINFKVLVNNTTYSVSADGRVYTLDQLANRLTAAFVSSSVPLVVEAVSGELKFTYIGENWYGSTSRLAFYNSAGGLLENDLNFRLGLTFDKFGEFSGVDTTIDQITWNPPEGEEPEAPTILSELVFEQAFDGVHIGQDGTSFILDGALGTTNLQDFSDDALEVNDCITVRADEVTTAAMPTASYRLVSWSTAADGGITLNLDREVLLPFDGSQLLTANTTCSVRITREYLKVVSPSPNWGETRLSGWLGNFGLDAGATAAPLPEVPPLPPVPAEDYQQLSTFFTYKVTGCANDVVTVEVYMSNTEPISGFEIAVDLTKYGGQFIGASSANGSFTGSVNTLQIGPQTVGRVLVASSLGSELPIGQDQLVVTLTLSPCQCAPGEFIPIVEKVIGIEDGAVVNLVTGDVDSNQTVNILDIVQLIGQLSTSTTLVATLDPVADASGSAGIENIPGLANNIMNGQLAFIVPKKIIFLGPATETISQAAQDQLTYSLPTPNISTDIGGKNYSEGTHTTLVLVDTIEMGSPIRIRDAFVTADSSGWEWPLGGVLSSSGTKITVGLYNDAPVPDPPGSATKLTYGDPFEKILSGKGNTSPSPYKADGVRVYVYSLGAHSYRNLSGKLPDVTRNWSNLDSPARLSKYADVYVSTGTSKDLVDRLIYDYLSVNKATIEAYRSFDANIADGVVKLFRALGENKLDKFKELLLSLRFDSLFELELSQLSEKEEISQLLNTVASDYGGNTDIMNLTENTADNDFSNTDSVEPDDESIVWPSQED